MFKYIKLLDHLIFTFIEDLGSFRNKITLFCLFLTYLAVVSGNQWSTIMMGALTAIVLNAYFENRQKSTDRQDGGHHESLYKELSENYSVKNIVKRIFGRGKKK